MFQSTVSVSSTVLCPVAVFLPSSHHVLSWASRSPRGNQVKGWGVCWRRTEEARVIKAEPKRAIWRHLCHRKHRANPILPEKKMASSEPERTQAPAHIRQGHSGRPMFVFCVWTHKHFQTLPLHYETSLSLLFMSQVIFLPACWAAVGQIPFCKPNIHKMCEVVSITWAFDTAPPHHFGVFWRAMIIGDVIQELPFITVFMSMQLIV